MKVLTGGAVFLSLTAVAVAKPAPVNSLNPTDDLNPALARTAADINIAPAGASLERSYFEAPGPQVNISCRLRLSVFDKTRLAQSCN